jgi:hypothetical protein
VLARHRLPAIATRITPAGEARSPGAGLTWRQMRRRIPVFALLTALAPVEAVG